MLTGAQDEEHSMLPGGTLKTAFFGSHLVGAWRSDKRKKSRDNGEKQQATGRRHPQPTARVELLRPSWTVRKNKKHCQGMHSVSLYLQHMPKTLKSKNICSITFLPTIIWELNSVILGGLMIYNKN